MNFLKGIAPLPRANFTRAFTRTKVSISSSLDTEDLFSDEGDRSEESEEREGDQEESAQRSRDSFESGYSSGVTETVTKVLYYNEVSEEVAVKVDS